MINLINEIINKLDCPKCELYQRIRSIILVKYVKRIDIFLSIFNRRLSH